METVEYPSGRPSPARRSRGAERRVEAVQEQWRVDEGWWRERPVARHYYRLVLDGGRQVTIYRDLIEDGWWMQRY